MKTVKTGASIAAAAAALFTLGTLTACASSGSTQMADATVKCSGVNSCKGTSECKSASNNCKGQNSCKGQGWVSKKSADECTAAGGKVVM